MQSVQDCDTEAFFESALRDIDNFVEAHGSSTQWNNGPRIASPLHHKQHLRYEHPQQEILGEINSCVAEVNSVRDLLRTLPRDRQKDVLHVLNSEWERSTPSPSHVNNKQSNGRLMSSGLNVNNNLSNGMSSTNNAIGIMSMANSMYPSSISPGIHNVNAPSSLTFTFNHLRNLEEENQSLTNQVTVLRTQMEVLQEKIMQLEKNKEEGLRLDEKLQLLNTINAQQKKLNSEEMEKRSLFLELNQSKDELARAKQAIARQDLKIRAFEQIVKSVPMQTQRPGLHNALATLNESGGDTQSSPRDHDGHTFMNGVPTTVPDAGKATSLSALHDGNKPPRPNQTPTSNAMLVQGRGRSTSTQDTTTPSPSPPGVLLASMTPPTHPRRVVVHPNSLKDTKINTGSYNKGNYPAHMGISDSPAWASSEISIQPSPMHSDSSPVSNGNSCVVGKTESNVNTVHERFANVKSQSSDDLLSNSRVPLNDYDDDYVQKYGTMPMSGGDDNHPKRSMKHGFIPSAQSQEMLSNANWSVTKSTQPNAFTRGGPLRSTAGARLDRFVSSAKALRATTLPIPSYEDFAGYSCDHICGWLHDLQLAAYVPNARSWVRNGLQLLQANRRDLAKSLRISNAMHVKKLQVHLNHIKKSHSGATLKISSSFSVQKFLDDIGLLQYLPNFTEAAVDAYVLDELTIEDLLCCLHLQNELHVASLRRGIQLMRHIQYDLTVLKRRPNEESTTFSATNDENRLLQICLWSHHRVMEWLRLAQFPEFAANLRASGVHGALLVLEPRFTATLLASVLNIPEEKTLLRRHLAAEFTRLLGDELLQEREDYLKQPGILPLTVIGKQKLKKRYTFLSRQKKTAFEGELLCPLDIDVGCNINLNLLSVPEKAIIISDAPYETEID